MLGESLVEQPQELWKASDGVDRVPKAFGQRNLIRQKRGSQQT
jgi:hypothetical protein